LTVSAVNATAGISCDARRRAPPALLITSGQAHTQKILPEKYDQCFYPLAFIIERGVNVGVVRTKARARGAVWSLRDGYTEEAAIEAVEAAPGCHKSPLQIFDLGFTLSATCA
jgi:hypothetical protein